jgi:aminoglycoside/choline kinase family phosphotransferase
MRLADHTEKDFTRKPWTHTFQLLHKIGAVSSHEAMLYLPELDEGFLMRELEQVFEWFLPASPFAQLRGACERLCDALCRGPRVLQHMDLHSRNIVLDSRDLPGIVDFQDAAWGPPCLDAASLVFDQNFTRSPGEIVAMIRALYPRAVAADGLSRQTDSQYARQIYCAGLYWSTRILGVSSRLAVTTGRPHFQREVARAAHYIRSLAALDSSLFQRSSYRPMSQLPELFDDNWSKLRFS